jgi:hypothetical protein
VEVDSSDEDDDLRPVLASLLPNILELYAGPEVSERESNPITTPAQRCLVFDALVRYRTRPAGNEKVYGKSRYPP